MRASMMASRLGAAGLVLAGIVGGGCDWRTFDKDAESAPVKSLSGSSNFSSSDFGRSLLPLANTGTSPASFVATSFNDVTIVTFTVDVHGNVANTIAGSDATLPYNKSPIDALAEIPTAYPLPPQILTGTPIVQGAQHGQTFTLTLPNGPAAMQNTATNGWGRGVSVAQIFPLAPPAPQFDFVVAGDDDLRVFVGGLDSAPSTAGYTPAPGDGGCFNQFYDAMPASRYVARRALLTAPLWPASEGPNQIASASVQGGHGFVSFFKGVDVGGVHTLSCLGVVPAGADAASPFSAHFGVSMAKGDFNGDGIPDLLIGAPPQQAFVYLGPFTPGVPPGPPIIIADTVTGADFGFSVAAMDVDGKPGDEAVIGDPMATVGGQTLAGHVAAYHFDATSHAFAPVLTAPWPVADHSPSSGQGFGTSVVALPFCATAPTPCTAATMAKLLLVGAANEVFLYYRVGQNIPPRPDLGAGIFDIRAP